MNYELQKAEEALLKLLRHKGPLNMEQIQDELSDLKETTIRAAIWTLRAEGETNFTKDNKLKILEKPQV